MVKPYKNRIIDRSDFLTVSEAASIFGVTSTTIRNWDKSGKLRSRRHPKNDYRLYSFADLAKMVPLENSISVDSGELLIKEHNSQRNNYGDLKEFRTLVRQMSKSFRDSMGGSLMDRFEEISKLLYTKMYDERMGTNTFKIQDTDDDKSIYKRISIAYRNAISALPQSFEDYNPDLGKDIKAVAEIGRVLAEIRLLNVPADIKGTVFEELVKNTFDKTEHQQFFTPRTVVNFIIHFVDINGAKTVLDPACGTAGFLIEAAGIAKRKTTKLIGVEIDKRMAWISQMNLQIHGIGTHDVHYLPEGGSLSHGKEIQKRIPYNSVEIIVTNPPFGSDFTDFAELSKYRLGIGRKSRRRGPLFIERCISWLKPGGRLGIIIDDGVLNSPSNLDVRKLVFEHCQLEAVISLPISAFLPYASVKSSILFLKKKSVGSKQGPVFMADAEYVGRKPNGDPHFSGQYDEIGNPVLINDLPDILKAWMGYKDRGKLDDPNENIFLCDGELITDKSENKDLRIDVQFHHPSKKIAREVLQGSQFPLEKLSGLITIRNVSAVPNVQDPEDMWTYIGLANIASMTGEYAPVKAMGNQIKSSVKLYRAGDVLFSKLRPELRKVIRIQDDAEEGYVSSECYVLTPGALINSDYLSFILRSDIALGQLIYQVSGVGRPRINIGVLLGIKIPLPPIAKQLEIVKHLKRIEGSRRLLEKKIQDQKIKVRQLIAEESSKFKEELLS